ncbi:MAG: ATP-binding protein [Bacteroidota bacterium]
MQRRERYYRHLIVCLGFCLIVLGTRAQLNPYFYAYDQDSLLKRLSEDLSHEERLKTNCLAALNCLNLEGCEETQREAFWQAASSCQAQVPDSIRLWLDATEAYIFYHQMDLDLPTERDSGIFLFQRSFEKAEQWRNPTVFRWSMYGLRFLYLSLDLAEADISVLQAYSSTFDTWNSEPLASQIDIFTDIALGFRELNLPGESAPYFRQCWEMRDQVEDLRAQILTLVAGSNLSLIEADTSMMHQCVDLLHTFGERHPDAEVGLEVYSMLARLQVGLGDLSAAREMLEKSRELRQEVAFPEMEYAQFVDVIGESELRLQIGEAARAEQLIQTAFSRLDTAAHLVQTVRLYEILLEAQAAQGLYRQQSQSLIRYQILLQKRNEEQFQKKLLASEIQYETRFKSQRITQLEQEAHILNQQKRWIYTGLFVLSTLLLLLGWQQWRLRKQYRKSESQNQTLLAQRQKLDEIEAYKNNFFINIAHELRTPLSLIKGPVSHLQKRLANEEGTKALLNIIAQQGVKMEAQLNQILDLDREQGNPPRLERLAVNLAHQTQSLIQSFQALAELRRLQFEVPDIESLQTIVKLDAEKLSTILNNLLSNAFKFTPSGGKVRWEMHLLGDRLEIEVEDNGRGIPEASLPYIFERFYQVPVAQQEGGSGIGLAICKLYLDLMGGEMRVESSPLRGTLFQLSLPVRLVESVSEEAGQSPGIDLPPQAHLQPKAKSTQVSRASILIVEDQPEMQRYLQSLLQDEFSICPAYNGAEAIKLLQEGLQPQLIISDIMMPEMDGRALAQQLQQQAQWRQIPLIILTAKDDEKLAFLRIGVDDYLTKPFVEDELLARIDNLIDNYAQREQYHAEVITDKSPQLDYDHQWIQKLVEVLTPLISDVDLTLERVADQMAVSLTHLHRKVKQLTGMTAMQFIQHQRFEAAKSMLKSDRQVSIKAVSYAVGFKSEKHFSRNFKKRYGVLPSVYRAE